MVLFRSPFLSSLHPTPTGPISLSHPPLPPHPLLHILSTSPPTIPTSSTSTSTHPSSSFHTPPPPPPSPHPPGPAFPTPLISSFHSTSTNFFQLLSLSVLELTWDGRLEDARRLLMMLSGEGSGMDAGVHLAVLEAFVAAGRMGEAADLLVELRGRGFVPEEEAMQALIGTRGPLFRRFMESSGRVRLAVREGSPLPLLPCAASGVMCPTSWRALTAAVDFVARAMGARGLLAVSAPSGGDPPRPDLPRSAPLAHATPPSSAAATLQSEIAAMS